MESGLRHIFECVLQGGPAPVTAAEPAKEEAEETAVVEIVTPALMVPAVAGDLPEGSIIVFVLGGCAACMHSKPAHLPMESA